MRVRVLLPPVAVYFVSLLTSLPIPSSYVAYGYYPIYPKPRGILYVPSIDPSYTHPSSYLLGLCFNFHPVEDLTMSVLLICFIVALIFVIASLIATVLCAMVTYEMDFGKEFFSAAQRKRAAQTLWTLALCAAGIIASLFLLWVTYVP